MQSSTTEDKENAMSEYLDLRKGNHQHPIPAGLEELLEKRLRMLENDPPHSERWVVHFGPAIKGTGTCPRFKVVSMTPRNTVKVKVKPGGNDTVRVVFVVPHKNITLEELYDGLRSTDDHREKEEKDVTEKPKPLTGFMEDNGNLRRFLSAFAMKAPHAGSWTGPHGGWISVEEARGIMRTTFPRSIKPEHSEKAVGALLGGTVGRGYLEKNTSGKKVRITEGGNELINVGATEREERDKDDAGAEERPQLPEPAQVQATAGENHLSKQIALTEQQLQSVEEEENTLREMLEEVKTKKNHLKEALSVLRRAEQLLRDML